MSELIYEGKAKKIFSTEKSDQVKVFYKDSLTAFNALKKGQFENKGSINCEITCLIFDYLKKQGMATHLIQKLSDNEILVQKAQIIPLEVVVRNVLAGSTAKKFGKEEGTRLKAPLVEFYYKDDALADPFISDDQILCFEFATLTEIQTLKKLALEANRHLQALFSRCEIQLIDFKLEFGKNSQGEILLADEFTPDCARLWDLKTGEKMDKDRFRRDLGGIDQAYKDVLGRLTKALK